MLIPVFLSHSLTSVASISFVFLTYPDVKEAENAVHVLEGVSFGKNILHVNRFGDIQRFASLPIGEGDLPAGWKEKDFIEKVRFWSCLNQIRSADTSAGLFAKLARGSCWERSVCDFLGHRGQHLVERTQWKRRDFEGS